MSAIVTQETTHAPDKRQERTAWGILWVAFAAFCLTCAASGMGVYFFLFNSTVPMQSLLQVSRGTLGVTGTDLIEQVVRDRPRALLPGDRVTVNPDSQGLLLIRDLRREESFVAALTLRADSRVSLVDAARPRFDWSTQTYRVDLADVSGDIEVLVPTTIDRGISLALAVGGGDLVLLTEPGQYVISVRGQQIEVMDFVGTALLVADDRTNTRSIPVGQRGRLSIPSNEIVLLPGFVNLLGESSFAEVSVSGTGADLDVGARVVTSWICGDAPRSNPPSGTFRFDALDGRPAVHLVRGEGATTHGETRCVKRFGPGAYGLDISGYNYLTLRAALYVAGQSLSVCGVAGSECPLMLEMQYIPDGFDTSAPPPLVNQDFGSVFDPLRESPARMWHHGFYAVPPGENRSPLRCDTCPQDHTFVRSGVWYTYDSGNLLAFFPPAQRPRHILNLSFYASGHQYEVYVSEVSLIAGQIEVVN